MNLTFAYVFRRDFENPGDLSSCPMHYLTDEKNGVMIDVYNSDVPNFNVDVLILGGGAVLTTNSFAHSVDTIFSKINAKYKIAWGIGLNPSVEFSTSFDLFGIRDFTLPNHNWVPCSSVLHPDIARNLDRIPTKKFLVATHWKRPIDFPYQHTLVQNKPNCTHSIIEAIADHEFVLTTSYHVAYWSTLLKRKTLVIGEPLPAKFYTLRHYPIIAPRFTDDLLDAAVVWDNAYKECFKANNKFRQEIENLIGIPTPFKYDYSKLLP